jgi:hypothetical protein
MGVVMTESKQPSSYRLSEECRDLLVRLSEALGLSQAGVIEMAVRKLARAELDAPPAGQVEPKKPRKGRGK